MCYNVLYRETGFTENVAKTFLMLKKCMDKFKLRIVCLVEGGPLFNN